MANELKIGLSLSFSKDDVSTQKAESFSVDVAGEAYEAGVVTTSGVTPIDLASYNASLGTVGYVYVKLVSAPTASTYLKHGYSNTGLSGKLKIGESCILRMPNSETNFWVLSSAAENVVVEYVLIED